MIEGQWDRVLARVVADIEASTAGHPEWEVS